MGDSDKAQQLLQDSSWAWPGLDGMGFLGFFYGFLMEILASAASWNQLGDLYGDFS
jgi:hypothetical protein